MTDKFDASFDPNNVMKNMENIDKTLNELENFKNYLLKNNLPDDANHLQGYINKIYDSKNAILSQIILLAEERNIMTSLFLKSDYPKEVNLDIFKF